MLDFMTDHQARSCLTVDLSAIVDNYQTLAKRAGTVVGAVVKANAYGLGAAQVAPVLDRAGAAAFFVATIDEGVALRALTAKPIYVLGGVLAGEARDLKAHGLTPVINALSDLKHWSGPAAVHFDTGMNRLGLGGDDVSRLPAGLDIVLGISHFACSDEKDHPMTAQQVARFEDLRKRIKARAWSLSNSSGIFRVQNNYDLARPGYALYGGNPTPEMANPMKPVVRLEARVLQVRDVKVGETVGYGATHRFEILTQTATVMLGYADGFHRAFGLGGKLFFEGVPCLIVGRVSMDLVAVDISHLPRKPRAGEALEVLGPHQTIDNLAMAGQTIGYEVLTSLGSRYARRYINAS
jgi:alanine racemase